MQFLYFINTLKLRSLFRIISIFSFLIAYSCVSSRVAPIQTIENQINKFHSIIEDTLAHQNESYQSLAFSEMKIYKPESFKKLDSLYAIKQNYLINNDTRGLRQSGINDIIPGFRAEAQQDIDQIKYEIGHLYQTEKNDSIYLYHDFFLFNYKDSLISITPFYNFRLTKNHKDLFYAYQFELHFVDSRNLYISKAEQDFIRFFKQREMQLIGEDEFQPFMEHCMSIMQIAKRAQSVNYNEISKWLIIDFFAKDQLDFPSENYKIGNFGTLYMLEKEDTILSYEQTVTITNESTNETKNITFAFSPYLELIEVK